MVVDYSPLIILIAGIPAIFPEPEVPNLVEKMGGVVWVGCCIMF